ncbi:MAG: leucine-rich repeat domain-containing protein [Prevotella sp.]|nr:leucine-rich repeat domain-containing protein [Prevotella sp.]
MSQNGLYRGSFVIPSTVNYEGIICNVTSIGGSAFYGCNELTSVTIPNSVTSIGNYAFYYCKGLTSITIPNSVTSIGDATFDSCSGLTSVTIPNSVTSIGSVAFSGCSGLTSVTIPNSVTSIGDAVFGSCSGLTSVTFHCESIGSWLFSTTGSIKEITIGDEVTSIGDYAFSGCSSLTSVTIGNSVKSIGTAAFSYCTNVRRIISKAATPPVCGSRALVDINKRRCTLCVPKGYSKKYQEADQWKEFYSIKETDFVPPIDLDFFTDIAILVSEISAGKYDNTLDVNGDGKIDIGDIVVSIKNGNSGNTCDCNDSDTMSIDLGLASGTLWSKMDTKNGTANTFLFKPSYYSEAILDQFGEDWTIATLDNFMELQEACTWEITDQGFLGTSKSNGNTILLPFTNIEYEYSYYWTHPTNRRYIYISYDKRRGVTFEADSAYDSDEVKREAKAVRAVRWRW